MIYPATLIPGGFYGAGYLSPLLFFNENRGN